MNRDKPSLSCFYKSQNGIDIIQVKLKNDKMIQANWHPNLELKTQTGIYQFDRRNTSVKYQGKNITLEKFDNRPEEIGLLSSSNEIDERIQLEIDDHFGFNFPIDDYFLIQAALRELTNPELRKSGKYSVA